MTLLEIINNKESLYQGDLRYYFKVLFFKAPNLTAPYHNFRHMLTVTAQVYNGAKYMEYDKVGKDRFRALLIAALFHDFAHSGKVGNDKLEVERAIRALYHHLHEDDTPLLSEIEGLISITEFPHGVCDPSTAGKILRDADMAQSFSDVWMQQILFGLAEERGVAPIVQLQDQINFLSNLKFYTPWGETFKEKLTNRIKEAKGFLEILQS